MAINRTTKLDKNGMYGKSGWLQKWTNYIKGYRQRWFVLESDGNLSYYRNQGEVGQICRGSVNLRDASMHIHEVTNNIIIIASSQTFHLKALNEIDHNQWLLAMQYIKYRFINDSGSSDEDEQLKMNSDGAALNIDIVNDILYNKIEDLQTCSTLVEKHGTALLKTLIDLEEKECYCEISERLNLLKFTVSSMLRASNEFFDVTAKESRRIERYTKFQSEKCLKLEEQLKQLAEQHSKLEHYASCKTYGNESSINSEEEFYDATDQMNDSIDDRHSNSSQTGSSNGNNGSRQFFDAQIVQSFDICDQMPVISEKDGEVPLADGNCAMKSNRRSTITERPQISLNLWSIMRNCIGKELSKIPMPVNFNEPLSILQRISEDLEYSHLLDTAASMNDSTEQICYVAAFAISAYSTTGNRTTKPFNPLLGETYECDRTSDLGWRSFAEQVCHHPPITAHHAEGGKWSLRQDFNMSSRFRGKYLSVIPVGYTCVKFPQHNNEYSFKKVTTTVHNIIVGKLWIDNHGEMVVENHTTGDKCFIKFHAYSYFSRDVPRKVTGIVKDSSGKVQWVIRGTWDRSLDIMKVVKDTGSNNKSVFETLSPRRIWTVNPPIDGAEKMYQFTKLAIELNEMEVGVAPTDSRLRPDQRLMENGNWDDANQLKVEMEEKQRATRRQHEALAERAMHLGEPFEEYRPLWFKKTQDEKTGAVVHIFTGEYWEKKNVGDWSCCPDIF